MWDVVEIGMWVKCFSEKIKKNQNQKSLYRSWRKFLQFNLIAHQRLNISTSRCAFLPKIIKRAVSICGLFLEGILVCHKLSWCINWLYCGWEVWMLWWSLVMVQNGDGKFVTHYFHLTATIHVLKDLLLWTPSLKTISSVPLYLLHSSNHTDSRQYLWKCFNLNVFFDYLKSCVPMVIIQMSSRPVHMHPLLPHTNQIWLECWGHSVVKM